jgi:hypothetical protein
VFGSDLKKASQVSLPERMMRFAKGQKTGLAELQARQLNPAVVLSRVEALDALIGLCRGYITRLDEPGLRFEFAWGVEAEQFRVPGRLGFLHQMRTPDLRGRQLASATDALILDVLARQAFPVQLKAYRNVADLLFGRLALRSVTGKLRYASGPAIPQQIVTDFCRYLPWGNKVPGEGMDLPRTVFPETSGWYPLRPTVVFVIDDLYLRNKVFILISEAFHRTGKKRLDILTDINASPADKDQLIDMFPDGIVRGQFRSPMDFQDDFDDWLKELLSREEALLNEYLRTTDIYNLLGRYVTVRLVRAVDGVGAVLNAVGVAP